MAQNWTSRLSNRAGSLGRIFRTSSLFRVSSDVDADARRLRVELDAIRARFPDHS